MPNTWGDIATWGSPATWDGTAAVAETSFRWVLRDTVTNETYTFSQNPSTVTSFEPAYQTETEVRSGRDARILAQRQRPAPTEWSFGGKYRTSEIYDALESWCSRSNLLELTDHLGRVFQLVLTEFIPEEFPPTKKIAWWGTYEVKGKLIRRVS